MADMGLNTVAANEFVIKYQQKEYFICLKLWANNFLYITAVGGTIVLLSIIVAFAISFKNLLQVSVFPEFETSFIFVLLLAKVFLAMHSGTYNGTFRAVSCAHISTMIENAVRLFEALILFVGIWIDLNIIITVVLYLVPTCISIVYKHLYVQRWFKLKLSFTLVDLTLLKSFIKPSIAFMLMPLGFAIANQGMIFVVNVLLGSVILVTFTTTRTLVHFLRAVMNILGAAIWPEVSIAYGKNRFSTISILYHRSFIITFVISLFCIVLLVFLGKPVYLVWTRSAISFDSVFFYGMLAVLLVSCLWSIVSVILLATNNHASFSIAFLMTQSVGVIMTYIALNIYPDLSIIPLMLLIEESFLLWFVMKDVHRLLHIDFNVFRKKIPHEMIFIIKNMKKIILI
jgi:O-antigen/teichoic acid export membrane protein